MFWGIGEDGRKTEGFLLRTWTKGFKAKEYQIFRVKVFLYCYSINSPPLLQAFSSLLHMQISFASDFGGNEGKETESYVGFASEKEERSAIGNKIK